MLKQSYLLGCRSLGFGCPFCFAHSSQVSLQQSGLSYFDQFNSYAISCCPSICLLTGTCYCHESRPWLSTSLCPGFLESRVGVWLCFTSYSTLQITIVMSQQHRNWNIICWNIRGINSNAKWRSIRERIEESACNVICLQETKKESFDNSYLRKFCPRRFDLFMYSPFIGASGGILIIWNSAIFSGQLIHNIRFALTVNLHLCTLLKHGH